MRMEDKKMMSRIDQKPTGDDTGPEEKQSHARISRTIRFSNPEWERIEIAAKRHGATAAEFIRNAALVATGSESGTFPPGIAAQIERIYRGIYLLATLKRDEMNRDGRQEELERIRQAARESQDSIMQNASG